MPTITISKKKLLKLIGTKLSDDKLKDRISYLGTDLERIEGDEIVVEIFPNRPDLLSEYGLARALSSFIGESPGLRKYDVKKPEHDVIIHPSVSKVRPCTACAIVRNLKFDDEKIKEVIQIQEKLHVTYGRNRRKCAIGVYPFEKIMPPIRYMAKKPEDIKFIPLESNKEMNGLQILSQHPTGRDYGHLLESASVFPIFIDANDQILSMPPIINSHNVGRVSEKTKDVFIECSGFDYEVLSKCLNMIVCALADMGGEIEAINLFYKDKDLIESPDLKPTKLDVDRDYINKWLGLDLSKKEFKELFERMGYEFKHSHILVPAYRTDIIHMVDLAEDIAIAYGYENFKAMPLSAPTIASENKFEVFKDRIANMLVGLGLLEVRTYNLANSVEQTKDMLADMKLIKLKNPTTETYDVLRAWVIPSLLSVLKHNKHHEYPQNIFGIGNVFKLSEKTEKTETGVIDQERLGIALCSPDANFTKIKQVLDYIFNSIGIQYTIKNTDHTSFISGRVGRVSVGKIDIAYVGELHPQVLENFDMDYPVAALEINLSELYEAFRASI